MNSQEQIVSELFSLSERLRKRSGMYTWLEEKYWQLMLLLTRVIERTTYRKKPDIKGEAVLYFGCGVNFTRGVNSDLFGLHRYLKRRRCPDLYLSGTFVPRGLYNLFDGIVCEHVLEHMLPVHGHALLCNLWKMLKPDGTIQVSVPSPVRYVHCSQNETSIDVLAINNLTYNYGHRFMYDAHTLSALLARAGFCDIQVNSYKKSPWMDFLVSAREPESIYLIAKKSA
jgi:hypothetical protein